MHVSERVAATRCAHTPTLALISGSTDRAETVTPHNLERMRQLVENGPHPPPGQTGARYIVRDDGTRLDLRYLRTDRVRALVVVVGGCVGECCWCSLSFTVVYS